MSIRNDTLDELKKQYISALQDYLENGGEKSLERVYELGRKAIADGRSLLDIAAVHQDVLVTVLPQTIKQEEIEETLKKAAHFFSESIAPFEMNFRGFQDSIAELSNINKILEQSEMKFRSVVQAANDAIISSESNGNIISWNKCAETIFGYAEGEVLGKPLTILMPERFRYINSRLLERLMSTGESEYNEKMLESYGLKKDGSEFPIEISIAVWKTEEGSFFTGIIRDITERKRAENDLQKAHDELEIRVEERTAELVKTNTTLQVEIIERKRVEEALRESAVKYKLLTESIPDTFTAIDHNLKFTYWNRAAEELVGISADEALGKTVIEVFGDNEFTKRAFGYYRECMKTKQLIRYETGNVIRGRKYDLELRLYPTDNGVSIIGRDITERRMAEEAMKKAHDELELRVHERTSQLNESLEEKELLLREIHHRVKNNMQVISGLLMLQEEFSNDESVGEMLKESQNRIDSMALIHEKLYISESLSKIDFKEYVNDLVGGLFQSFGITESKAVFRMNAENIFMGIDTAIPCGLIINELISNSLKHAFPAGKKGEIEISLTSTGDNMIELLVSDNGIGIPEGIDFRKTESLGFHIVNILVENQLHGDITLNKKNGTEFRIKFKDHL